MKKYALLCVLMSMMSSAYAFEWVKVTEKEEFTMFIDRISFDNAKRQMTWWGNRDDIHWFNADDNNMEIISFVENLKND